jgi:hypothetical protein
MFDEFVVSVFPLSPEFGGNFVVTNDFAARTVKEDCPVAQNVDHTLENDKNVEIRWNCIVRKTT